MGGLLSSEGEASLNANEAGLFLKVNIAAQRARQLMQGAAPKIETRSRKPAAIAIQEVAAGMVEAYTPSELPEAVSEELFGPEPSEAEETEEES